MGAPDVLARVAAAGVRLTPLAGELAFSLADAIADRPSRACWPATANCGRVTSPNPDAGPVNLLTPHFFTIR